MKTLDTAGGFVRADDQQVGASDDSEKAKHYALKPTQLANA